MHTHWSFRCVLALGLVLVAVLPASALSMSRVVPDSSSETLPLSASHGLILDITRAASRSVAVGERGIILVSDDDMQWNQVADVPTRATLTAITAVGDALWAVGHDGIILHSADGGLSWQKQREDVLDTSPDASFDPRQGMPLLDVLMLDDQHGFAVGAYAQLLRTEDGGAHWHFVPTTGLQGDAEAKAGLAGAETGLETGAEGTQSQTLSDEDLMLDEEAEPHFNAIVRSGSGALLIVGERGAAYRSRDQGHSWERLQLPYGGSMFGALGFEGEHVLAFGMRGSLFESTDMGSSWMPLDSGTELSLMGGAALDNGGFALVGANGIMVMRVSAAAAPRALLFSTANQETPVLSGVLAGPDGRFVVTGEKGVASFSPRLH